MKTKLPFAITALLALSACGSGVETDVMQGKFSSMDGCVSKMKGVSGGPIKIVTDKPTEVSGKLATGYYFFCKRKETGSQGKYYEGTYERVSR